MKQTYFPEKDNKKTYRTYAIVIGILLIIAIIVVLTRGCEFGSTVTVDTDNIDVTDTSITDIDIPETSPTPGIVYDTGAVEGGWETVDADKVIENLHEKVADGMINISMNTSPTFIDGTASGNLMIVNETVNRYPQVVEITRNDNGEMIYKSGAIPAGSKIERAPLSVNLDAGTYECTAMFYNVDPNTGAYLGCAGAIIHVTVQN